MADYNKKLADYNNEITKLESDQHTVVNSSYTWPLTIPHLDASKPYAKVDYHFDITWHWDATAQNVIVTNVDVTLTRENPVSVGGGFWDALVFVNPNSKLNEPVGSFDTSKGGDIPGVTGDTIWNNLGNQPGVQAFFAQNNKTHAYTIKYNHNNSVPYGAVNKGNGVYDVLDGVIRQNDGTGHQILNVKWGNLSNFVTIHIPEAPVKPTLKTTEVHYHYNPMIINI